MNERDQNDKRPFDWVTHSNGTYSIRDLENDQAMHSRIGPWEEANRVYAEPSRPETFLNKSEKLVIHDVGMGTGANAIAALERVKSKVEKGSIEIHSFELKPDGIQFALSDDQNRLPFLSTEYRKILGRLLESKKIDFLLGPRSVSWHLHTVDYFQHLSEAPPADLIYYDFYSPKVVPELWTEAAFRKVLAHQGSHPTRLFTYSAATPTRLHLLLAGFFVGEGRSTGIKTETTIASNSIDYLEAPLKTEWLKKLETSSSISGHPEKSRVLTHPQFAEKSKS